MAKLRAGLCSGTGAGLGLLGAEVLALSLAGLGLCLVRFCRRSAPGK